MAAPEGNQNYLKGRRWKDAIDRALAKRSAASGIEALDELAEKLLKLAEASDLQALKELGDRLDGKAAQPIGGDPNLPPIRQSMALEFVGTVPPET